MNEQWSVIPVILNVEKWGDCEKCERFPKQELMIMNLIYAPHSMYSLLLFHFPNKKFETKAFCQIKFAAVLFMSSKLYCEPIIITIKN